MRRLARMAITPPKSVESIASEVKSNVYCPRIFDGKCTGRTSVVNNALGEDSRDSTVRKGALRVSAHALDAVARA